MTDARITLDAAALDRWAALLARITDHCDGTRPFAEVYDDDLSAFVAQSRLALTQAERIATLEAELAEARTDIAAERKRANDWMARVDSADHEGCAWQAHANALRDALGKVLLLSSIAAAHDIADAALAQTPAASLAALKASLVDTSSHDAEVLERAASFAESFLWNIPSIQSHVGASCGDGIRALAAQGVKP